jgi:hypothetical protein
MCLEMEVGRERDAENSRQEWAPRLNISGFDLRRRLNTSPNYMAFVAIPAANRRARVLASSDEELKTR